MLSKFIFALTFALAQEQNRDPILEQEQRRQLAGAGSTKEIEMLEFEMEHTSNEGYKFHYLNYGEDWGHIDGLDDEDNFCKAEILSPINLMAPIGSYGWAYGYPHAKVDDEWSSNYVNDNDVTIEWDYNNIRVTFTQENAARMFMQSNLVETVLGGRSKRF